MEAARTRGMESLVEPTIERWFSRAFQIEEPERVERVREMIRTTPVAGYCGCCAAIRGLDLTDRLSEIRLPTLSSSGRTIRARRSRPTRSSGIGSRVRLVVVRDAMHFSNVEQAEVFNETLGAFLAEH